MFDVKALNKFYDDLSAQDGMSVTNFHNRQSTLFAEDRSSNDLNDYRLGKNHLERLGFWVLSYNFILNADAQKQRAG